MIPNFIDVSSRNEKCKRKWSSRYGNWSKRFFSYIGFIKLKIWIYFCSIIENLHQSHMNLNFVWVNSWLLIKVWTCINAYSYRSCRNSRETVFCWLVCVFIRFNQLRGVVTNSSSFWGNYNDVCLLKADNFKCQIYCWTSKNFNVYRWRICKGNQVR